MKLFFRLILFVFIAHLLFRVYSYREEFLIPFNADYWRQRYLASQWVDPLSTNPIGDDGLFTYAAWEYIQGGDPSLINAETPPLGKYLIGASILIFKNQNIFALLVGILTLFVFYKLNLLLFKDRFLATLPVVFFSFEPLFYTQLRAPYLDTLYLLFLLTTFYFLLKEKFLISAIFLGLMAATKNTASTFLLMSGTCCFYLLVVKIKRLPLFFGSLLISFSVLLLTYFRYFWLGHSLRDFLGLQKWILNFYAIGAKGTFAMVFPMLLFNRWQTWWSGVVKISEWQISWPILPVVSVWYLVFSIWGKRLDYFSLLLIWVIIYLAFLSFIPVWPRYFLNLLPFLYILSLKGILLGFSHAKKILKT